MRTDNGHSTSVWMDIDDAMTRPPLTADAETDVCIVGAGIAGLSVAYELAKTGTRVIVLDDGPIGGGETCRTTAHLASALDDGFTHLEFLFGKDGAKMAVQSHVRAIDRMEEIVKEEAIDCDFQRVDGYLFAGPTSSKEELSKEKDVAARAGLDVELLDTTPLPAHGDVPCIRFKHQGQFHPTQYLAALATAIERMGGKMYCGSHARDIEGNDTPCVKTADGKTVRAKDIVVATNSPINERYAMHTKQSPYRSYVVALAIPHGAVQSGLLWDDEEPYHYVRIQQGAEQDVLIVGGEDHKTAHANDAQLRYQRLEQWARARFPMATKTITQWSGQVLEPIDSLAFIGKTPMADHVYIVTGDSGHGMTHGVIAGMLLPALIAGNDHPWKTLYDPSRKNPKAVKEFMKDGIDVTRAYCDIFTGSDVASPDSIKPDSGAVIRQGRKKIALYRDTEGALHARSAVCPHLGCIVRWNDEEKTWDCPCHGSRFTKEGAVVNGPALSGLKEESFKA